MVSYCIKFVPLQTVLEARVQSASEKLEDVVFGFNNALINITADVLRDRVEEDGKCSLTVAMFIASKPVLPE